MDTSPSHPTAPPLADAGLRCPKCEYNLTGLAEDRCPECGEAFDRDKLRSGVGPIPAWEDRSNLLIRFAKTCLMTWFTPASLGRRFPHVHDRKSLSRFKAACLGVALSPLLLLESLSRHDGMSICIVIGCVCGALVCERWARGILGLCFGSTGWDQAVDAWTGLAGLCRSFLLLTAAAVFIPAVLNPRFPEWILLAFGSLVAWWSFSLCVAAVSRGYSYGRAIPAVALLWLSAVAGVFVGGVAGMFSAPVVIRAVEVINYPG